MREFQDHAKNAGTLTGALGLSAANAQGLAPEPAPENQDSVIGDAVGGAALDIGVGAVGLVVEGRFSIFL